MAGKYDRNCGEWNNKETQRKIILSYESINKDGDGYLITQGKHTEGVSLYRPPSDASG